MQRQRDPLKESMLVPRGRKEFVINSTFRAITGFEVRTRPVTSLPLVAGFMSDFQSLLITHFNPYGATARQHSHFLDLVQEVTFAVASFTFSFTFSPCSEENDDTPG